MNKEFINQETDQDELGISNTPAEIPEVETPTETPAEPEKEEDEEEEE